MITLIALSSMDKMIHTIERHNQTDRSSNLLIDVCCKTKVVQYKLPSFRYDMNFMLSLKSF